MKIDGLNRKGDRVRREYGGGGFSNTTGLLKGHMEIHCSINFLNYIKRI